MNKRAKLVRVVTLILLLSTISLPIIAQNPFVRADPGWLAGWDKRVKITMDSGDVDDTLSNFPHLIHLSSSCGENSEDLTFVFDEVGVNSKKIAVTTSDGTTECYVEVDKWDSGSELAWLWTKAPSVASGTDTDLYLYFDNDHADNDAYVGVPNSVPAENVWDANFVFVSHMRDDPDNQHIRDSTTEDNDGTKGAAGEPTVTTSGKIDDAQDFDGDDYIAILDDPSLDGMTQITVECWVKLDSLTGRRMFITKDKDTGRSFYFSQEASGKISWGVFSSTEQERKWQTDAVVLSTGTWYYIVSVLYTDDTMVNYVDAVVKASTLITNNPIDVIKDTATPVDIGRRSYPSFEDYVDGIIDEARISDTPRPAAWVKASYESQRDHLNDFGSEETLVTVTDTDTYTTTSCTSTTTTSTGTGTTTSTDYTTTTNTISITTTTSLSSTTTTSCITACETCTLDTTTITVTLTTTNCSTSCMTAYITSTNTTFVDTKTTTDISTSTDYTETTTIHTATSIEGVIGGGGNILTLVGVIIFGAVAIAMVGMKKRW